MSDYKESKEWGALNRIWKTCSSTDRAELYEDFEIIMSFIKEHYMYTISTNREKKKFETESNGYLSELPQNTKQFVLDMVQAGEKNLYHSIMAIIGSNKGRFKTVDDLWDYYSIRNQNSRPYIFTHEKEVREIIELCLQRVEERGGNSCDEERAKKYMVQHDFVVKDLSPQAQALIKKLEREEGINLYQSIMGTLGVQKEVFESTEELWVYYIKRKKEKHPSMLNYKEEIIEIMEHCLAQKTKKSKIATIE